MISSLGRAIEAIQLYISQCLWRVGRTPRKPTGANRQGRLLGDRLLAARTLSAHEIRIACILGHNREKCSPDEYANEVNVDLFENEQTIK